MFELSAVLSRVAEAPLWMLVLLKVTALLTVGWVLHFCLRRANPRWRVLLWRGVAIGLIAMPAVTLVMPAIELRVAKPSRAPVERTRDDTVSLPRMILPTVPDVRPLQRPTSEPVPVVEEKRSSRLWTQAWRWCLPGLWVVGVAVLAFRLWLGHRRVKRFIKGSHPAPETVINECHRVAEALRCKRDVDARRVDKLSVPFLMGLRRPVLLLPERMCDPSYETELSGIIAHELSHIRSRDLVWGYVLHWLSILLWFHPFLWPVRSAHASACEEVSDAVSSHFVGDTNVYSRTLARVAVDLAERPPATAGIPMARVSDITRRLKALKRRVFSSPLSRRRVITFVLIGLLAVVILGGVHIAYRQATEKEHTEADIPQQVQEQTDRLSSRNSQERADAARKLAEMGEGAAPAVPALVAMLCDEPSDLKVELHRLRRRVTGSSKRMLFPCYEAAKALGEIGKPAVEPLIAALQDENPLVRGNAARALQWAEDRRAVEPLIALVGDADVFARSCAYWALKHIVSILSNENDTSAVEPLIDALGDKKLRWEAAQMLGILGDNRAVDPLVALLTDDEENVRWMAAEALREMGTAPVEPLIAALKVEYASLPAASVLGETRNARAVELLIEALEDANGAVRDNAAIALARITGQGFGTDQAKWREWWEENRGTFGETGTEPDTPDTSDSEELAAGDVATESLSATGSTAAVDPAKDMDDVRGREGATEEDLARVKELVKRLNSPKPLDRRNAARKLGEMREKAASAVPYLVDMLHDEPGDLSIAFYELKGRVTGRSRRHPALVNPPPEAAKRALGEIGKAAVSALVNALRDRNPRVRERAAYALGKTKDSRAVEPLIAALNDEYGDARERAAEALGEIGDGRAVEPLIGRLGDEDFDVRGSVADALGRLGDSRALESLIAALDDEDVYVRSAAARGLGCLGDSRAVEPLLAALDRERGLGRSSAVHALGQLGDGRAVEPLIAGLEDEVARVRVESSEALGGIGEPAVEPLIRVLSHENERVRSRAAQALGLTGDIRAIEPLIAMLNDEDAIARRHAADALMEVTGENFRIDHAKWREWWEENKGTFGETGAEPVESEGSERADDVQTLEQSAEDVPPEVQELIEQLQSEDRRERAAAALNLREMGEDAAPAVPALIGLLGDETPVVGWTGRVFSLFGVPVGPAENYNSPAFFAGMALRSIGAPAVEPLIAALDDKDSRVRKNAALDLGMTGDARAFEPLVAALNDKDAEVRGHAARALGILNDSRAVEPLIGALQDKDSSVGVDASFALGRIGEPAVEPLIAMLKHRKRFVRQNALMALADTGDARAVEPLIAALEDKDYHVRDSAVRGLMEIGEERAVEPLIAALEDKEWVVRASVVQALVEIAGGRGIDPLIGALKDKDPSVRERAARGLGKLGDGRAIEPLIGALKNEDVCVRTYAAIALADLGDTRAVEPLIAALDISLHSRKRWEGMRELPIKLMERNLRTDAVQALKRMTGRYLGLDPAKWRAWWEENKGTFGEAGAEPVESEAPIGSE